MSRIALSSSAMIAVLVLTAFSGLTAQDDASELMAALGRRPLSELVQELPGRPASLNDLIFVALERNIPLEASRIRRRLAEAGVDIQGGDFDLALSLGADLAKSRFLSDRSGSYSASLGQVLPWGTALGVDLTGTQTSAPSGSGNSYDADVGLFLSQPLLDGFRTRDTGLRVARLLSEASIHRLTRATATTTAEVELTYW